MRKVYFILICLQFLYNESVAQLQISNYILSRDTTTHLVNLSNNSIDILYNNGIPISYNAGYLDLSSQQFKIKFMGIDYHSFNIHTDGQIQLGDENRYNTNPLTPYSNKALISPFATNGSTSILRLHYRLDGVSPNRVLVIEWEGISIPGYINNISKIQALLYESSNKIEFRYQHMISQYTNQTISCNTYLSNSSNSILFYDYATQISANTSSYTNQYITYNGPINGLSSASDSNQVQLTYTPGKFTLDTVRNIILAYDTLNATINLKWTIPVDTSHIKAFAIFSKSTNTPNEEYKLQYITSSSNDSTYIHNINFFEIVPGKKYSFLIKSISEASESISIQKEITLDSAKRYYWVGTNGNFGQATNWNTRADNTGQTRIAQNYYDILIIDGDSTYQGGNVELYLSRKENISGLRVINNTNLYLKNIKTTSFPKTDLSLIINPVEDQYLSIEKNSSITVEDNLSINSIGIRVNNPYFQKDTVQGDIIINKINSNNFFTLSDTDFFKVPLVMKGNIYNLANFNSNQYTLKVDSGANYYHQFKTTRGNIPYASWSKHSTIHIDSFTTNSNYPLNLDQTFGTIIWDCANQQSDINIDSNDPINDYIFNLSGDFILKNSNNNQLNLSDNNQMRKYLIKCENLKLISGNINISYSDAGEIEIHDSLINQNVNILNNDYYTCSFIINGTKKQYISKNFITPPHSEIAVNNNKNLTIGNGNDTLLINDFSKLTLKNGEILGQVIYGTDAKLNYEYTNDTLLINDNEFPQINGPSFVLLSNKINIFPFDRVISNELNITNNVENILLGNNKLTIGKDTITLGNINFESGCKIIGRVEKWVSPNSNFTLPIGDKLSAKYLSIIMPNKLSSSGSIEIEFVDSIATGALPNINFNNIHLNKINRNGYWRINALNGLDIGNNKMKAIFRDQHLEGVVNPNNLYILNRTNNISNWTLDTFQTKNITIDDAYFTIDSFSNYTFGEFAIGSDQTNPLPIKLLSFKGSNDYNINTLNWTTASEYNNYGYYIERLDLISKKFKEIGFQNSIGNTNEIRNYIFNDLSFSKNQSINYYRLRIKSINNEFEFSDVISINSGLSDEIKFFPNPVVDKIYFTLNNNYNIKNTNYEIYNLNGILIKSSNNTIDGNSLIIDVSNLNSGFFLLRLIDLKHEITFLKNP